MKKMHTAALIAATGLLAASIGAFPLAAVATSGSASISGKVVSSPPHEGPVPLAGISVNAKDTHGRVFSTRTRSSGRFALSGLPAGTYAIKFSDTVGHRQCDGGCGSTKYFATEWLGDKLSYAGSAKITLTAGQKHAGVREVLGERSRISGTVTLGGKPVKGTDVRISAHSTTTAKKYALVPGPQFYFDVLRGNYRIKVYSVSKAFPSFYVTDSSDGNQVFHANGVDKRTGLKVDIPRP